MDIFKILLIYMAMNVTGPAQQAPDLTPPPVTPAPIVTPAPVTPVPASPIPEPEYTTLRPGNEGPRVQEMQEKLIELGFLTGKADGQYGPKTKEAVSAYQRRSGLKVDGIAGNDTLSRLYSADPMLTPTPPPSVIPAVMVRVYYMDRDTGSQLYAMDITCYGSTTIYANGNHVPEGYQLVSENAVYVKLEDNKATPSSVTFYYSGLPAEEAVPAVILMHGQETEMAWFTDENGTTWLSLKELAPLLGWDLQSETSDLFGHPVTCKTGEDGTLTLTLDGVPCTEDLLQKDDGIFLSLSFLQKIGCHAEMTDGIPDIAFP